MLTHVVLFKLKDRSQENALTTRDRIAAITGKIPPLRSLQVGVNTIETEHSYDIAMVATFNSLDALHAFQTHPVHLDLLRDVMSRYEAFTSVDFES